MGWKQQSQYRYQYTSDGRGEMAWQPTLVYEPDTVQEAAGSYMPSANRPEDEGVIFLLPAGLLTILVCHRVSGFRVVEHLASNVHGALMWVTGLVSFFMIWAFLQMKFVRRMIKVTAIAVGIVAFLHMIGLA